MDDARSHAGTVRVRDRKRSIDAVDEEVDSEGGINLENELTRAFWPSAGSWIRQRLTHLRQTFFGLLGGRGATTLTLRPNGRRTTLT